MRLIRRRRSRTRRLTRGKLGNKILFSNPEYWEISSFRIHASE